MAKTKLTQAEKIKKACDLLGEASHAMHRASQAIEAAFGPNLKTVEMRGAAGLAAQWRREIEAGVPPPKIVDKKGHD